MSPSLLRQKIREEIRAIPEARTQELYELVRQFRLRSRSSEEKAAEILSLAGSWKDMPEKEFSVLCSDFRDRRHRAGSGRRSREAVTHNRKHFDRIEALEVEDWSEPQS